MANLRWIQLDGGDIYNLDQVNCIYKDFVEGQLQLIFEFNCGDLAAKTFDTDEELGDFFEKLKEYLVVIR